MLSCQEASVTTSQRFAAVKRAPGNNGVFEISDPLGTAYRADAVVGGVGIAGVEWLLLRIR